MYYKNKIHYIFQDNILKITCSITSSNGIHLLSRLLNIYFILPNIEVNLRYCMCSILRCFQMAYCNRQVVLVVFLAIFRPSECASKNHPPQFLPGGDMARFSLSEDTPVGKSVYKLSAIDPDGTKVSYTISGQHLSVDRSTGVVTLVKNLDRETLDSLEVVISVTGTIKKRQITDLK